MESGVGALLHAALGPDLWATGSHRRMTPSFDALTTTQVAAPLLPCASCQQSPTIGAYEKKSMGVGNDSKTVRQPEAYLVAFQLDLGLTCEGHR